MQAPEFPPTMNMNWAEENPEHYLIHTYAKCFHSAKQELFINTCCEVTAQAIQQKLQKGVWKPDPEAFWNGKTLQEAPPICQLFFCHRGESYEDALDAIEHVVTKIHEFVVDSDWSERRSLTVRRIENVRLEDLQPENTRIVCFRYCPEELTLSE